jgi:hypothetical protein
LSKSNKREDLKEFMLSEEGTFAYCTASRPETCVKAVDDLEHYLETEGPYDGVIGFSMGASFILSWMIGKVLEKRADRPVALPFKVGIFFSNAGRLLKFNGETGKPVVSYDPIDMEGVLDIPTAHIWGSADPDSENAELASQACNEETRSVLIHERGHEVPMSAANVISAAKVINRAIARAQGMN